MNRRTLFRVLAVALALAAMSPLLLEADCGQSQAGLAPKRQNQISHLVKAF
jgi:hypothetical protein